MRWMIVAVAGLALAGCHRADSGRPIPIEGDSITYETGPCFGRCPVFTVTIRPDGSGVFTGRQHTAVTGERAFKGTPADYQRFAAALGPYRPESGEVRYEMGGANCKQAVTDMPSVDVRWTRAIGDSQGLHYYYGCRDAKNQGLANALGNAPDTIPALEAMIGERP